MALGRFLTAAGRRAASFALVATTLGENSVRIVEWPKRLFSESQLCFTYAQGLWAELLLVAHSSDPSTMISSWHSDAAEEFDFELGRHRLEMKSSASGLREHELGLNQLSVLPGGNTLIASILLEDDPEGASIEDLAAVLFERLRDDAEQRLRVETILARSLGRDWRAAAQVTFAVKSAIESLQFYAADSVPSVSRDFPPEVSHVRFRVDLSSTACVPHDDAARIAPLYGAALPTTD